MTRKILILDDQDFRHEGFKQAYEDMDVELFHAKSYKQFKELLEKDHYSFIWLDHDLGSKKNGCDAARLIVELKKTPAVVYVHSANWAGAIEMVKIIHGAGIMAGRFDFRSILQGYLPHQFPKE